MIDRYSKDQNNDNKQTVNQVVIVLKIERRQTLSIYSESNNAINEQRNDTHNLEEFKFLVPIVNLIYLGIDIRIILLFKSYSHYNDQIQCFIQSELNTNFKFECEFAISSGDLWHLLSKNIHLLDIIHIFSNEPQRVPDLVLKYLQDNKVSKILKIMKNGNSMQDHSRVVTQILSKIDKNLIKNERFIAKTAIMSSSKSTAVEIKLEEASKIEDQTESSLKEKQENFENVDAYQVMYNSFVIKFKNHFSATPKTDIKSFINTFEALLNQHITKNTKEEDKDYFTKEFIEKYLIYVLRRLINYKNRILKVNLINRHLENSLDMKKLRG